MATKGTAYDCVHMICEFSISHLIDFFFCNFDDGPEVLTIKLVALFIDGAYYPIMAGGRGGPLPPPVKKNKNINWLAT